ncbi:hypothetical protein [Phytohabitans rumicis]|uniref:Uncharacterized protein n=1 Tax=Phytohabitans rumicis TaxID=1076125 RepID=A0A6V8LHC9_9ACTN|nr:hypothetical protein [Phytohabitans rumicis]GFJ93506.1 hypothetical protein Prum_071480 [Phytohabitans rumicis]
MSWPAVYVVMDDDVLDQLAGWHLPADDGLLYAAVESSGLAVGPTRSYRIVLDRWGALGIDSMLAGGPGFALSRMLAGADKCRLGAGHAAVLVDVRRRRLLFHYSTVALAGGGGLGASHVDFRLGLLALLSRIWEGWQVDWAWRGDLDLAEHIGLVEDFRQPLEDPRRLWPGVHEDQTVVMVRTGAEVRVWSTMSTAIGAFLHGPSLVDGVDGGVDERELTAMPAGGLYLDPHRREMDWWTTGTTEGWDASAAAAERWPGWRAQFLRDDFSRFFARWAPAVDLPVQPLRGLAGLRHRLNSPGAEHRYGTDRWELLQVALTELQARSHVWGYE